MSRTERMRAVLDGQQTGLAGQATVNRMAFFRKNQATGVTDNAFIINHQDAERFHDLPFRWNFRPGSEAQL